MRKIYTILAAILLTSSVFAQAPQKMSYQAVIRNAGNSLVTNHSVGMKISILQGTTLVYIETQTPSTNSNGLVSLVIGTGISPSGFTFSGINWANGPYFIKTETDPSGGTNYTIAGTSELLSVPFALFAANSGGNNGWSITGNTGTNSTTNFIGTTDDNDLVFKRNGALAGKIGILNLSFGWNAFISNTSGAFNTAIGNNSLLSNTIGTRNTASGSHSLYNNLSGDDNTVNGVETLFSNTTGSYNTANGSSSLFSNTTGSENAANGFRSLYSNTTGNFNTANGFLSLFSNTTGFMNTAN